MMRLRRASQTRTVPSLLEVAKRVQDLVSHECRGSHAIAVTGPEWPLSMPRSMPSCGWMIGKSVWKETYRGFAGCSAGKHACHVPDDNVLVHTA